MLDFFATASITTILSIGGFLTEITLVIVVLGFAIYWLLRGLTYILIPSSYRDEAARLIHNSFYVGYVTAAFIFWLIIFLSTAIVLARVVADNQPLLMSATHQPGFLIPCLGAGYCLYWIRRHCLICYALGEIFFSITTISYTIQTPSNDLLSRLVPLLGGTYIIVSGLNNINSSIPEGL
jgi:hypothetical protein